MADRIFAMVKGWALASDGIQWTLMRERARKGAVGWQPVSFVRSTKDILARCMREKGVEAGTADFLLAGLPATFDEWNQARQANNGNAVVSHQEPSIAA